MILGMKVRKHDLEYMLKFNPHILEFHFSDSDLDLHLEGNFNQRLMVHCFEYFDRKLLDIVSLKETNQIHSQEKTLELIQKAIDKTVGLGKQFVGTPSIIVHPGGYSINDLASSQIQNMREKIVNAVRHLDTKNVNFLLENMPPYAWFFGGRWNSNVFLGSSEIINYCNSTGLKICYDLCHAQLYCNKNNLSIINELTRVGEYVEHFHLSDAGGTEEEGLQFGDGDLPFDEIIQILNKYKERSFVIEVWRGHDQKGEGFKIFLDRIKENGLVIQ